MKVMILVIVLSFCSSLMATSDTLRRGIFHDTIFVKTHDSCYVITKNYPKQTWLEKNEGSILGALFGCLIAVFSVYLTNKVNQKSQLKKEIEIYCGFLYAIKIELFYQQECHKNLIEELKVIQQKSMIANEFILKTTQRNISLSFLKELRIRIIDSEIFNTDNLRLISYYINKCELVNCDINFEQLKIFSEKYKEQGDIQQAIKSYFDDLIIQLEKLIESIPGITDSINTDLTSLGKPNLKGGM